MATTEGRKKQDVIQRRLCINHFTAGPGFTAGEGERDGEVGYHFWNKASKELCGRRVSDEQDMSISSISNQYLHF